MLPSTMTAIVSQSRSLRTMPSAPRAQLIGAMFAPAQIHICCGPVESLSASGMGSMLWTSTLSSARASVVMLAPLAFGSGLVELSEEPKIRASPVPARYCAADGEAVKIRDGCESRLTLTVRSPIGGGRRDHSDVVSRLPPLGGPHGRTVPRAYLSSCLSSS